MGKKDFKKATFAGGCFWCTEAVFKRLRGVKSVTSGYTGGDKKDPTCHEVAAEVTGHAEAVQINYDPNIISYKDLLYVFFKTHDPTTLNRQGADVGSQYRSAIFYHDSKQKKIAEEMIKKLSDSGEYDSPIVTEVEQFDKFYEAGEKHKDFYENNRNSPYCRLVIDPKIKKLEKDLTDYLDVGSG